MWESKHQKFFFSYEQIMKFSILRKMKFKSYESSSEIILSYIAFMLYFLTWIRIQKCQINSISQQDSQYYHITRIGLLPQWDRVYVICKLKYCFDNVPDNSNMIHRKVYYFLVAKTILSFKNMTTKHIYKAYQLIVVEILQYYMHMKTDFSTDMEILNHHLSSVLKSSKDVKTSPPACISPTCACLSAYQCDMKHTNLLIFTLTLWQRRVLSLLETLRPGLCGCWASLFTEASWYTAAVWLTKYKNLFWNFLQLVCTICKTNKITLKRV